MRSSDQPGPSSASSAMSRIWACLRQRTSALPRASKLSSSSRSSPVSVTRYFLGMAGLLPAAPPTRYFLGMAGLLPAAPPTRYFLGLAGLLPPAPPTRSFLALAGLLPAAPPPPYRL